MDTEAMNRELKELSAQQLAKRGNDVIEKLKLYAMKNGIAGIKTIGRRFRVMDYARDRKLDLDEFIEGCRECRVNALSNEELEEVFRTFDKDGSGTLDFDEFLMAIRPKMNATRKKLIKLAFAKMDRTGDGVITLDDLAGCYNVHKHHKFINGEKTEKELLVEFLNSFEAAESEDGLVTLDEFVDYFSAISTGIDEDAYFNLMMENAWGVKATDYLY